MKKELRRRLLHLQHAIERALACDDCRRGLFPALYSVFSYIWIKNLDDLHSKRKSYGKN